MAKITSVEIVNFGRSKTWGDSDDTTGAIRISDKCKGRKHLEIALHEGLHIKCPYFSEEAVIEVSADLTRLLWHLGYRLPDNDDTTLLQDEEPPIVPIVQDEEE